MHKNLHNVSNITEPMISAGRNVKSNTEALVKIPVRHLYDALCHPRQDVQTLLGQLRAVHSINPRLYPVLKTQLPYFVCAMFNPPYRKTENFAYTEYFIIDIDHISEKGMVLSALRERIESDPRAMLCFKSPGGDGLKVMFRLEERCYDAGQYKVFYKLFLMKFSEQYGLQQVVDSHTCDVARACFMSCDSEAYFNPESEPVRLSDYIDTENNVQEAFDLKHETDKETRKGDSENKKDAREKEPPKDIIAEIKQKLGIKGRKAEPQRNVFVPEALNSIIDNLREYIESYGIRVTEIVSIQYGKKLRMVMEDKRAEINLFYGKRGFTVVQSPRSGTDMSANEAAAMVIQQYINENCY